MSAQVLYETLNLSAFKKKARAVGRVEEIERKIIRNLMTIG